MSDKLMEVMFPQASLRMVICWRYTKFHKGPFRWYIQACCPDFTPHGICSQTHEIDSLSPKQMPFYLFFFNTFHTVEL